MQDKVIIELPILSQEIGNVNFIFEGMKVILKFNHHQKKYEIIFDKVLCYRHSSERFTKYLYNSYDQVIQIYDSRWIKELQNISDVSKEEYDYWKPNHYAIYLDSVGLFEVIACSVKLLEE